MLRSGESTLTPIVAEAARVGEFKRVARMTRMCDLFAKGEAIMAGEIQVPVGLSGVLTKSEGVSFCMDGATHLLHTVTGATRLKGRNDATAIELDSCVDGCTQVMVMGYPIWGPECLYVSVYSVALVSDVNRVLGGDGRPWPWKLLA